MIYYSLKTEYLGTRRCIYLMHSEREIKENVQLPDIRYNYDMSIYRSMLFFNKLLTSEIAINKLPDVNPKEISFLNWLYSGEYAVGMIHIKKKMPNDFNILYEAIKKEFG